MADVGGGGGCVPGELLVTVVGYGVVYWCSKDGGGDGRSGDGGGVGNVAGVLGVGEGEGGGGEKEEEENYKKRHSGDEFARTPESILDAL